MEPLEMALAAQGSQTGPVGEGSNFFLRALSLRFHGRVCQFAALFLIVMGVRLWLVQNYTTPLPFWDQWDGEGGHVIKPWLEGRLSLGAMFAPHNEHRIFLTRAITLGLFVLNGQWDAQVEMVLNAALCGVLAVVVAAGIVWLFGSDGQGIGMAGAGLLFTPPFAWENTLMGFQSQFYLLFLFSLLTIWGLSWHPPLSGRWWVGAVSAVLACLTMASGFFAAAVVFGSEALRLVTGRGRLSGGSGLTLLLCGVITLTGWITRAVVPEHAVLKAQSVGAFMGALAKSLAWPFCRHGLMALVMYLPLAALGILVCATIFRRIHRALPARQTEALLAFGAWALLQAASIAYARGGNGNPPASRYMDLLAFGAVVNFLAAALLISWPMTAKLRRAGILLAAVWSALAAVGLADLTRDNFKIDLPERRAVLFTGRENVKDYLRTGDFERCLANKPLFSIPFPSAQYLAALLDDPVMRRVLPASVLSPEMLAGRSHFARKGPLSRFAGYVLRRSPFVVFVGCALLLGGLFHSWLAGMRAASFPKAARLVEG